MKEERYIAALEISSSKIIGAVGAVTPDGSLRIIAMDKEESKDSVRYGMIQNPEEVASRVIKIVEKLNNNPAVAPKKIKGIFVGLSGRSMHSIHSDVKITYPEETEITEETLRGLKNDAKNILLDSNLEIIDIIPQSYHIDGLETTSPKGAIGKSVTADYVLIAGRTELRRNILRALPERTGLHINKLVLVPLAAADLVLSDEEKRLGCMLVDFGAETTTVCIYHKGALCYYATLPLGGRNITIDLTTLSMLEEKAEEIKIESGKAIPFGKASTINISGVKLSDINNLIVARAEEIVANVIQQIFYANLKIKDLPGGIICIGAAANLTGLTDLIAEQSGMNVRMGTLPPFIQMSDNRARRNEAIQIAALLNAGASVKDRTCLEMPEMPDPEPETLPEVEPEPVRQQTSGKVGKLFNRLTKNFTNMFATPTDDESELD